MKTTIPNLIFQEETNECGLACVAMLAQTQGQTISLETLRDIFQPPITVLRWTR